MVKKLSTLFVFVLLVFPYFIFFEDFHFSNLDWNELSMAFKNTFVQSILSVTFVIIFGFWAAMGLNHLKKNEPENKKIKFFEFLCLAPSFLPPLFFTAAMLQILTPFPFGIMGIIIIHTLMYVGLCALVIQSLLESKFHNLSEMAYLEGASRWLFLRTSIKNMKSELVMVSLFLFIQFFTSFSVPLLVGLKTLTVETLIYDKIRTIDGISHAVAISFLESVLMMGLLLFYKSKINLGSHSSQKIHLLSSKSGLAVIVLPVFLFILGSLIGSFAGIGQLESVESVFLLLLPLIIKSAGISILTGVVLMFVLSLVSYTYKNKYLDKFILSYIPLSTVLLGLSLLMMDFQMGFIEQDLKVVTAMVILFLPVLYRLELKSKLSSLESQIEIASMMGAEPFLIFRKIVFPQVLPSILFLSGLGAFWAIGDFAISQIIYGKDLTLALFIQNLVGSYRLELANLLVIVLLILGLFIFTIFKEMRHVTSQKN